MPHAMAIANECQRKEPMNQEDGASIAESSHGGKRGRPYHAYLLRCWCEEEVAGQEPTWRFSVEEIPRRGPRRGFTDLKTLLAFLERQLGENPH